MGSPCLFSDCVPLILIVVAVVVVVVFFFSSTKICYFVKTANLSKTKTLKLSLSLTLARYYPCFCRRKHEKSTTRVSRS